ncbi:MULTISPECIES: M28 family peptidase [unclassified Oceanispirochaeta]|uniref:M28 family peptidase n=1 Tax=unclassified Oceanispirochaeta TaxID=2635722 RepID=UPI00131454E4|nr:MULTISPECIES: M28 family peptidase [unclassified Oceanispirochaeta]MBF9017319.1 M28 family peptidase [Oceanispirochaeta sp. M2]NPD73829.1 M28 family peptidase [Oceanispirochaeta sp. M1]
MKSSFNELLSRFCDSDCDRFKFITTLLEWKDIPFDILPGGGNHILVHPRHHKGFLPDRCRKILTAHYDRVPGTPGANDNSAAVFMLLKHIDLLQSAEYPHNTLVLFTDSEELLEGDSIKSQGAWQLAELWPEEQRHKDLFFVFDMCGIGETLIWGRTAAKLPGINMEHINGIYDSLKDLLYRFSRQEEMNINDLFSDDLGFLLQGLTALQISMLPWKEANEWKKYLSEREKSSLKMPDKVDDLKKSMKYLPPSWRNNHSAEDRISTLDDKAFKVMESFLRELSRYQIPLLL